MPSPPCLVGDSLVNQHLRRLRHRGERASKFMGHCCDEVRLQSGHCQLAVDGSRDNPRGAQRKQDEDDQAAHPQRLALTKSGALGLRVEDIDRDGPWQTSLGRRANGRVALSAPICRTEDRHGQILWPHDRRGPGEPLLIHIRRGCDERDDAVLVEGGQHGDWRAIDIENLTSLRSSRIRRGALEPREQDLGSTSQKRLVGGRFHRWAGARPGHGVRQVHFVDGLRQRPST